VYTIGTPLYERIDIRLENGSSFVIIAPERTESTVYIKSATLNGVLLEHPFIPHADIINGGMLYFEMSEAPTHWGSGLNEAIQK
jgi:putative alpha-1,2-mannosidase